MKLPNQKKSNSFKLKIIVVLFLTAFVNINCEHCDDEDYTREQEENVKTKKSETIILNKN